MRHRRILMQMAGLVPMPYERMEAKAMRQLAKYARKLQQREQLLTLIARRERGESDTKPMPFARDAADE